jgi:hypothetical protein
MNSLPLSHARYDREDHQQHNEDHQQHKDHPHHLFSALAKYPGVVSRDVGGIVDVLDERAGAADARVGTGAVNDAGADRTHAPPIVLPHMGVHAQVGKTIQADTGSIHSLTPPTHRSRMNLHDQVENATHHDGTIDSMQSLALTPPTARSSAERARSAATPRPTPTPAHQQHQSQSAEPGEFEMPLGLAIGGYVLALLVDAVSARDVMEECDVISVVTEFMVGSRFGSRCDGRAHDHPLPVGISREYSHQPVADSDRALCSLMTSLLLTAIAPYVH